MKKEYSINRRQFLKIIAASGAIGLAWKLGLRDLPDDQVITDTRLLMGTVIDMTLISDDPANAKTAIDTCFACMSELEGVLSRFMPSSQLSTLNRTGTQTEADPALVNLVKQSIALSQLSNGAFDITVKPLLDLYRAVPGVLPSSTQIDQALNLVGYRNLELSGNKITFHQPGMSITLDGIAKGFIVDKGIESLQSFGYTNALVEAGGDLMGLGEKAPSTPWKIGLQSPRAAIGNLIASLNIQNQAIATSGDYMQAFTPDFANHHIIDPRIGHSSPELASVSVIAGTAAQADALATTVMVMGRSGLQLIEQMEGCEAFAISKDMSELKTSGFKLN
jgi:thiamine biosynthesis lipoprotein